MTKDLSDEARAALEAARIKPVPPPQYGQFQDAITIGFDKVGEADFRISMRIAEFDLAQMNELRRMIPVAIAEAERIWCEHGPPSKDMAQAKDNAGSAKWMLLTKSDAT